MNRSLWPVRGGGKNTGIRAEQEKRESETSPALPVRLSLHTALKLARARYKAPRPMFSGHGPRFLGAAAGCLAVGFAKGSGKSRCDGREASRGSGLAAGIHGLSAVKNIMRLERIDSTGWSLEDGDSRRWWRPSTWSWFRHERPEGRVTGSHHGDDNGEGWDEIMSKRTIKRVSRVVNAAMDLDYFGEEDEQKIKYLIHTGKERANELKNMLSFEHSFKPGGLPAGF